MQQHFYKFVYQSRKKTEDLAKVLAAYEREKKEEASRGMPAQHRHFTPFVVSTDGRLGKEAKIFLKKKSALLAEKCEKPY
jgi:hypothetical protein